MENSKQTPSYGDWFFSEIGGEIISMPIQTKICSRVSGETYDESMANGRLMAASKELLAAVQASYNIIFNGGDIEDMRLMYQPYKDALSKAGFPIVEPTQSDDDWDNLPF